MPNERDISMTGLWSHKCVVCPDSLHIVGSFYFACNMFVPAVHFAGLFVFGVYMSHRISYMSIFAHTGKECDKSSSHLRNTPV